VEVKTACRPDDIDEHLARLERLRTLDSGCHAFSRLRRDVWEKNGTGGTPALLEQAQFMNKHFPNKVHEMREAYRSGDKQSSGAR